MSTYHVRLNRATITGSIPSKKSAHRMVSYAGLLKRAYIYLLEHDPSVLSYETHPFSLSYQVGNRIAQYTPDFRVIWKHERPRLVSCAYQARITEYSSIAQWTAAQLWCDHHSHDFALITEETLRPHNTLLAHLEILAVHSFSPIPPQTYDYVMNVISSIEGSFSPTELVQRTPLLHAFHTTSLIWNLVYRGELLTNLTQPLHVHTTALIWKGTLTTPNLSPPEEKDTSAEARKTMGTSRTEQLNFPCAKTFP
jgi:hypothetical protein